MSTYLPVVLTCRRVELSLLAVQKERLQQRQGVHVLASRSGMCAADWFQLLKWRVSPKPHDVPFSTTLTRREVATGRPSGLMTLKNIGFMQRTGRDKRKHVREELAYRLGGRVG